MDFPKITIVFALVLILLGVVGFFGTGMVSITALIPAFFGLLFLIAGLLARRETLRKHAMHAASLLALVAIMGTVGGVADLIRVISGNMEINATAAASKSAMAILSIIYFILCLKSFIDARRNRKQVAAKSNT